MYNYIYNIPNKNHNNVTLPTTTSIPLTGWSAWGIWYKGIMTLAGSSRVKAHLCEPPDPNQCPMDPTEIPSYSPHFDENSTPDKIDAYKAWRWCDAITLHIVQSQLTPETSALIPMIDPNTGMGVTAHMALETLREFYGMANVVLLHAAQARLCNYQAGMTNIVKFVTQWRGVMLTIQTSWQPVVYTNIMLDFINNLPNEFNNPYAMLKQEVYNKCFKNPTRIDYNYFVHIINHVLTLDSQYQASHVTRTQSHPRCTNV